MSDTDELLREVEEHTDGAGAKPSERSDSGEAVGAATSREGGLRSRAAGRAASVFAPKSFLLALGLATLGLFVGGSIPILSSLPIVGQIAGLLGVFAGTFVHGLVARNRRYAESAVAGGAVAGVAGFLDFLVWTVVGVGIPIVALLAILGVVAGLLGHYFGRDLRAGLTQDI